MAEGGGAPPFKASPFDIEVLMLLEAETETIQKRSEKRLLKDVNVQLKDATKSLVTKPIWPYERWHLNVDVGSGWENLSEFSGNQSSQVSSRDHGNSLGSCESEVCEADNATESSPSTDKGTGGLSDIEQSVSLAQKAINEVLDLLNVMSVYTEKFARSDIGSPSADSVAKEGEQTEATQGTSETSLVKENWGEETNADVADSARTSSSLSPDSCSGESSEEQMPNIETDAHNAEKLKTVDKPVSKDVSSKMTIELQRKAATEAAETEESPPCIPGVHDKHVCEDSSANAKVRSEDTFETKSDGQRTVIADCGESQNKMTDLEQDLRGRCVDEAPKAGKNICTSKTPHFKPELRSPLSMQSVLYHSIRNWRPNIGIELSVKTDYVRQFVRRLMDDTVHELQEKSFIFSKCYIIETGSMAEGTKIGQPDEFDFNLALPMLADSDVTELFFTKIGIQAGLRDHVCESLLSFLHQFPFVDSSYRHFLTNAYLLLVFRETVREQLPKGWIMLEESDIHMMRVFLKNQTLTIHLQCTYGPYQGFTLSIDVCYGIPLDAERLQTVFVGDLIHAVFLSFIQSECLRMNTEVLAVISRNPLVGQRFFYRTEPGRFCDNKSAADCYKLAKHVSRIFLPKILKNKCRLCEDTLIPSFHLKTVVSFMMDAYTKESEWSGTQLGNRLIEVFEIISYSFVSYHRALSYYSYINGVKLDNEMKYNPKDGVLKVGIGLEDYKSCTIPHMEDIGLPTSQVNVSTAVQSYWKYMVCEEWTLRELLDKLIELLYVLKFTDTNSNAISSV